MVGMTSMINVGSRACNISVKWLGVRSRFRKGANKPNVVPVALVFSNISILSRETENDIKK